MPNPDILSQLNEVSLLSEIREAPGALQALAGIMTRKSFLESGEILLEGTPGTEMFILVEGQAAVYKNTPQGDRYKVAIFRGENKIVLGEGGLIENETRTATIVAESDCVCLVLERQAFEKFSRAHPEWALPIYRKIAHSVMARLKNTNNDMLLLYNALVAEIRGN